MGFNATSRSRREFCVLTIAGAVGLAGCADDEEPTTDDVGDDEGETGETEEGEYDIADQPDDAAATFVRPEDGETVSSPVEFEAEIDGIDLAPAGDPVVGEGHLHLLVDHEAFGEGEVIPGPAESIENEEGIYHWDDGRSEGEVELEPGEYIVVLQIGDGPHRAFGETDEVTITVEDAETDEDDAESDGDDAESDGDDTESDGDDAETNGDDDGGVGY